MKTTNKAGDVKVTVLASGEIETMLFDGEIWWSEGFAMNWPQSKVSKLAIAAADAADRRWKQRWERPRYTPSPRAELAAARLASFRGRRSK